MHQSHFWQRSPTQVVQSQIQHIQRVPARRDLSSKESPASQSDCLGLCHCCRRSWEYLLHVMLATAATPVNTQEPYTSFWTRRGMPLLSRVYNSANPRTYKPWVLLHFRRMTALTRPLPPTSHSCISLWSLSMPSLQPDSITTPGSTEGAILIPTLGDFCVPTYGPSGNR